MNMYTYVYACIMQYICMYILNETSLKQYLIHGMHSDIFYPGLVCFIPPFKNSCLYSNKLILDLVGLHLFSKNTLLWIQLSPRRQDILFHCWLMLGNLLFCIFISPLVKWRDVMKMSMISVRIWSRKNRLCCGNKWTSKFPWLSTTKLISCS